MSESNLPPNRKKNVLDDLNNAVLDMTEQMFGKEGREFLKSAQTQLHDFSISATKAWVNFADQVIEETELGKNTIVQKTNQTVKDLLKQIGVLEEETEDDF